MENKYLTVTALNKYIAYKFDSDNALRNLYVKAEVSNFRISGGHLYFSLKDENSEIRAIMFSGQARKLKFMPADGMTVIVSAQVSVYQKGGTYNLNVYEMQEVGLGELYLNFLRLKEKLQKEGLFSEEKKLPLPEFSNHIALITSPTGDALHDVVSTINKRWPLTKVYLYPALVQGVDAPASIIKALKAAQKNPLVEVIIIARGGGSAEDLSCFNDEALARAIFSSAVPTVSGVGHEADFTICDFVASKRAPTPTGAAVLITKDQSMIAKEIYEKMNLIRFYFKKQLEKKYYDYENLINRHHFKNFLEILTIKEKELERIDYNLQVHSPRNLIEKYFQKVNELTKRLKLYNLPEKINLNLINLEEKKKQIQKVLQAYLKDKEQYYLSLVDKMITVNPLNLLRKGYVLTYQNQKLMTRMESVSLDKDLEIRFADGNVIARAVKKNKLGEYDV
jgi:exodeoxyribonuclease VII large subunit